MKQMTFIVLHYGKIEVTDICVRSILEMEPKEYIKIIIVDNEIQKNEKEREVLIEKYKEEKQIQVLQIKENGGFSYANNQAFQYAVKENIPDYMVFCNNDIEFQQKLFLPMVDKIYKETLFDVMGPDVLHRTTKEHQNPIDTRIRTKKEAEQTILRNKKALQFYNIIFPLLEWQENITEKRKLLEKKNNIDFYLQRQEDVVLFGACLIFSKKYMAKRKKIFYPETSFYYEEYILAHNCMKHGDKMVYDPSIQIWHETGAATKSGYKSKKKRRRFVMERIIESCEIYKHCLEEND